MTYVTGESLFIEYWPNGFDGIQASPENYHMISDSQASRAMMLFIRAYRSEVCHTNMFKSVTFVDRPARLRVTLVGERGDRKVCFEHKEIEIDPHRPKIECMGDRSYHFVSNLDSRDYLATRIEI